VVSFVNLGVCIQVGGESGVKKFLVGLILIDLVSLIIS